MFKRKLKALGYVDWDKVNANDPQHFRKVIIWLEDQKIRYYKIDDRKPLRDINSQNWQKDFKQYCDDLQCPIATNPLDQLEWIIGHAIWLEYGEERKKYQQVQSAKSKKKKAAAAAPTIKATNPLDNLDFNSDEFKEGVNDLAKLLRIARHTNHLITLEACSKVVCERLNAKAIANPNSIIVKGKPYPIMDVDSGFALSDRMLDKAAKILSLLYIQDLRNLQTMINETIVTVQSITANPKTDTKLGKVGK